MADIPVDGTTKVAWVETIANRAAPTAAELNAGIDLTDFITADGLIGYAAETAEIDNSSLASTFDTKLPGRASYSGSMFRLKKQTGVDAVYDTLIRNAIGNVVVRRYVDQGPAFAAGDELQVYPTQCGEIQHIDPEANTVGRYEVPTMVTTEPEMRALAAI